MTTNWLLRIGDGDHFAVSSKLNIWGINSKNSFGKYFIRSVVPGDRLWFVKSASKGLLVAVSTFTSLTQRELGPLVSVTRTNEELGWVKQKGEWDVEVHFKDLYDISDCELLSEIKGMSTILKYTDKCKVNLPQEYPNIVRYRNISEPN